MTATSHLIRGVMPRTTQRSENAFVVQGRVRQFRRQLARIRRGFIRHPKQFWSRRRPGKVPTREIWLRLQLRTLGTATFATERGSPVN
jgi:hypothetical protein